MSWKRHRRLVCTAVLGMILVGWSAAQGATYVNGLYTEADEGFTLRVPEDWERTLTRGNQASTHLFVSPDQQVAVGVSVYPDPGGPNEARLLERFQTEGFPGAQQLLEQPAALNGVGGTLRAYRMQGGGDPIIAVALGMLKNGKGYVVWHMIAEPLYEQRHPESDAVMDTFLISREPRSPSPGPGAVPLSRPADRVPDFFGRNAGGETGGTAAGPAHTSTAPQTPGPPAQGTPAGGTLDPDRFPLFTPYEVDRIPQELARRPSSTAVRIPEHDTVDERTVQGGQRVREYRKNGRLVASERLEGGKPKSVILWTTNGKGRVVVAFWDDGSIRSVDYLEGMDKQGVSRFWDTDGTLSILVTYRDNRQDGPPLIRWLRNADHTLSRVEHRSDGKRHGMLRTYHRNGRLEEESFWENGSLVRKTLYFPSGKLRAELRAKEGRTVGVFYNEDGSIQNRSD